MLMKSELEQPLKIAAAAVWAEEAAATTRPAKSSGVKWVAILATLLTLAIIACSVWVYVTGLETLRVTAAQGVDTAKAAATVSLLKNQATLWAIKMGLVTLGVAVGFPSVTVFGWWWWQRRLAGRLAKQGQELQRRIQKLQDQLVDSKISEEEARKSQSELEQRFSNLSQTHISLQEELNQRKLAEKSLTQQTQKLERSKDVLELHVQAR